MNPLEREGTSFYALGDVLASVVLRRRAPRLRRAWRLVAVGRQEGLSPVGIRTGAPVDPTRDFFTELVERRQAVKHGDVELSDVERAREETVLKVIANAAGYGITAEYVRALVAEPVDVRVYRPDGSSFTNAITTPEEPGEFCFPPIAACITAAARLMLSLLEHEVTSRGGSYAFCDTDSMAIVATRHGGLVGCPTGSDTAITALSWADVDEIVAKFARLNPYDQTIVPGSILKVEAVNFDKDLAQREIWCYAIAAKRYCLFGRTDRGVELVGEPSEHGLGHLLSPIGPDDGAEWIRPFWELILRRELGIEHAEPAWLDEMVVSRVTASGPHVLQWFRGYNAGKPYAERVKPANFVLLAHPHSLAAEERSPIAPYEPDPSKRPSLRWTDRHTGDAVIVTTDPDDGAYRPDVVHVRTFRDVAAEFVLHPEAKSLAPDGTRCSGRTEGLLSGRPVVAEPIVHLVGKEGNEIDDRASGVALGPEEYQNVYVDPDEFDATILPILSSIPRTLLVERSGLDPGTIGRYLSKDTRRNMRPRRATRTRLVAIALEWVREQDQ